MVNCCRQYSLVNTGTGLISEILTVSRRPREGGGDGPRGLNVGIGGGAGRSPVLTLERLSPALVADGGGGGPRTSGIGIGEGGGGALDLTFRRFSLSLAGVVRTDDRPGVISETGDGIGCPLKLTLGWLALAVAGLGAAGFARVKGVLLPPAGGGGGRYPRLPVRSELLWLPCDRALSRFGES